MKSNSPAMSLMKPGMISRNGGDHDHDAMHKLAAGIGAGLRSLLDFSQNTEALNAQQDRTGDSATQHEEKRDADTGLAGRRR